MINCPELNKEFATKEDVFKALKKNAEKIISLKKANVFKSHEKGAGISIDFAKDSKDALKAAIADAKSNHAYAIINTTNYFDSHHDVHFNDTFAKSVKDNNGKIFYVADHSLKIDDVIVWPEDVNVFLQEIDWTAVGKSYPGKTQALIYEFDKSKIVHEKAAEIIEKNRPVQNSVRMQYIQIKLAVNSTNPDYKNEKAVYDSLINLIANKDEVEKNGYFWAVNEAKIYKEGSMVIFASNDATAIESIKDTNQPLKNTDEDEPLKNTQQRKEQNQRIQL